MAGTIGFLGPVGTFGHEAVRVWDPNADHTPLASHLHVLEAVERGELAQGIVAVENSIDGTVNPVIDYFIHRAMNLQVCGEVVVPVNQCLFTKPGVALEDVRVVISHPTGLGQCTENIHQYLPSAKRVEVDSTAAAVVKMLESEVAAVAIAGKTAAKDGTIILRENFQDAENNATRFWVVRKSETKPTGWDKTSLAFETFDNVPGALLPVYAIFAARGLNLSKIESRPSKKALGNYVFLMDVEAHQYDKIMVDALRHVRACTPKLWIFGSYPRWRNGS